MTPAAGAAGGFRVYGGRVGLWLEAQTPVFSGDFCLCLKSSITSWGLDGVNAHSR